MPTTPINIINADSTGQKVINGTAGDDSINFYAKNDNLTDKINTGHC